MTFRRPRPVATESYVTIGASCFQAVAQTIPSGASVNLVNFETAEWVQGAGISHPTDQRIDIASPTGDGFYVVRAAVTLLTAANNASKFQIRVRRGGFYLVIGDSHITRDWQGFDPTRLTVATTFNLQVAAGSGLDVECQQFSGGPLDTVPGAAFTYFQVEKMTR